jgi:hypothetical protein
MATVKLYRKKPIVIEAVQATPENLAEIISWCPDAFIDEDLGLMIGTLEGDMHVSPNDYVIRGVQGEFYPCKPDIFEATYESLGR